MIQPEFINEVLKYLREDCSYASIVGTIEYGDIDPNIYKKQEVKEQSFAHEYIYSQLIGGSGDCYSGRSLIPYSDYGYLVCEWSS